MCYNVILKPELPAKIYYQHPVNSSIEDGTDFLLYFDKEDAFLVAGLLCFVYCAGDGRVSSSSIAPLSRSTIGQLFKMCFVVQLQSTANSRAMELVVSKPSEGSC